MCEAVISSKCRAVPSSQLPDGGWRTSCLHCCSDLQAVRGIVLVGVISQFVQQRLQDGLHSSR